MPITYLILFATLAFSSQPLEAAQTLFVHKVNDIPAIDGNGADSQWKQARPITTHDKIAKIDITLRAVYTNDEIAFLVTFPDENESRNHKSWVWDKTKELYTLGRDREDVFIIKWNMGSMPVDLSIYADNLYSADLWFWKACRTDPVGYADDKYQILADTNKTHSKAVTSRNGKTMYLIRKGDEGQAAFSTNLQLTYNGDELSRFSHRTPTGSRADVKAKGIWASGTWTIEFKRRLSTGYDDDVQFDAKKSYQFGVSRYELAGGTLDPSLDQPLYGAGDIGETIELRFSQ